LEYTSELIGNSTQEMSKTNKKSIRLQSLLNFKTI